MTPPEMSGPLTGVRGIVLTQAWAGNWCTSLLGQMGADVIQVEVRKRIDIWRGSYDAPIPSQVRGKKPLQQPWNMGAGYNSICLNKRCITLDLGTDEGMTIFKRLVPFADFVAENFSPRVMGNFGIGYEQLKEIKPDIILASLSGYGHDGPWANVPAIGGTIEPTAGQSALLGYAGDQPLNSGQMFPDPIAAMYGVLGIAAALRHRDRTGEGQYVDLSMQEANASIIGDAAMEYVLTGRQRPRMGNRHTTFAPHGIFPAAGEGQWVALACETDAQWRALSDLAGRDWAADARFTTLEDRKRHEDDLEAAISEWSRETSREELVAMLLRAGVIAAPVHDAFEVARDEQMLDRGFLRAVDHPQTGEWTQATLPVRFSATPAEHFRPAPCQGEHTAEVLEELLGLSSDEVDALVAAGISGEGPPA